MKTPHGLQPSIFAASPISDGSDIKDCRIRNAPNGVTAVGRIRAHSVLIRFSFFSSMNVGTSST